MDFQRYYSMSDYFLTIGDNENGVTPCVYKRCKMKCPSPWVHRKRYAIMNVGYKNKENSSPLPPSRVNYENLNRLVDSFIREDSNEEDDEVCGNKLKNK